MKSANVLFAILAAPLVCPAQSSINVVSGTTNMTTPLVVAPGNPRGVYPLNGFESIDTYTGKVNIAVPLVPIQGRGTPAFSITAALKNYSWQVQVDGIPTTDSETGYTYMQYGTKAVFSKGVADYGFNAGYGPGTILLRNTGTLPAPCQDGSYTMGQTFTYVIFAQPDGSEHSLFPATYPENQAQTNVCPGTASQTTLQRGPLFVAYDNSGIRFLSDTSYNDVTDSSAYSLGGGYQLGPSGTLFFPSGTKYHVESGLVQYILDRNGNKTSFSYKPTTVDGTTIQANLVSSITDSTGRVYSIDYSGCTQKNGPICDTITYPTYTQADSTTTQVIKVYYSNLTASLIRTDYTFFAPVFNLGSVENITSQPFLSEIDLPNGTSWKFFYTPYGEIAKVVLPTGGAIEYDHGPGLWPGAPQNDPTNATALAGVYASGQVLTNMPISGQNGVSFGRWYPAIYRRLFARREYNSVVSSEDHQKRSGTADRTDTYISGSLTAFETPSSPVQRSDFGLLPDGTTPVTGITITGGVQTLTQAGSNMATVTIQKSYHDLGNVTGGYLAPSSPANTLYVGQGGPGFATVPDLYQGKEYDTITSAAGSTPAAEVHRVFGPQQNGITLKVCQENVTMSWGSAGSLSKGSLSFYDKVDGAATVDAATVDAAYQFGNLTDTYEYDFGSAPTILLQGAPVNNYDFSKCPSKAQSSYDRRHQTKYLQDSQYITLTGSTPVYLPSLISEQNTYDGSGGKWAQNTYKYDESTPTAVTATQSAYCLDKLGTKRGNLTKYSRALASTPPFTSSSLLSDVYGYDCLGNVLSHQDPRSKTTTFAYDDDWYGTASSTSTYAYPTKITLANSTYLKRSYDFDSGLPTQEVGPIAADTETGLKNRWEYSDPLNRLTHIERGVGLSGNADTKSDYTYNDSPQTGDYASSVEVKKDQYGSASTQRLSSLTGYDALGRDVLTQASGSDTIQIWKYHDALGRVHQQCNPKFKNTVRDTDGCTTYSYDVLGRVISTQDADGSSSSTVYSASSNTEAALVTDEAAKQRTLYHDSFGRLLKVTEQSISTTTYSYDVLDDLTDVQMKDTAVSQTTQLRHFTYDSLKRVSSATNPETGQISYTYDENGNVLTKTDGRYTTCYGALSGTTCVSGYDSLNRVTRITYSDPATPSATYCYDGLQYGTRTGSCGTQRTAGQWLKRTAAANWIASAGPPATITDVSISTAAYDLAGRLTGSSQTTAGQGPYPFIYKYYYDDSLASITYPSQRIVTTCYDNNGRIAWLDSTRIDSDCIGGVSASSSAYAQASAYWPQGTVKTLALRNGLSESTSYNNRLQMIGMTAKVGTATRLGLTPSYAAREGCGTGNNGNLTSQTIAYDSTTTELNAFSATQTYCYDGVNRLTTFAESALSHNFSYDGFGNRWETTVPVSNLTPTTQSWYDVAHNQIYGTSPDAVGNQQTIGVFSLTYDANNRITRAAEGAPANVSATYVYDADGHRVQKTWGSTTTYVYDGFGHLAAEYGGDTSSTGLQFLTADHLGSTRLVTDSTGNVLRRYDYLPFGEAMTAGLNGRSTLYSVGAYPNCGQDPSNCGDGLSVKFTGKERDAETGLDYFGARYFSAAQGRFTSPDPTPNGISIQDPQSWNLYSYVRNRPTRFVDVNGEWATSLHGDLVTAALSGYVSAGALKTLVQRQYVMDADQSPTGQFKHFMSGGEAPAVAAQNAWSFVASEMTIAQQNTLPNGIFQQAGLDALGDLIHTVQDFTSPMHTTADGTPMVWNGGFWPPSKWGPGYRHVMGEGSPYDDWARIGDAIRLTMAAFMQASPELAARGGLTPATFNREAEKRINDYVQKMWTPNTWGDPAAEDAARQCALGNPAACGAYQDMDHTRVRQ